MKGGEIPWDRMNGELTNHDVRDLQKIAPPSNFHLQGSEPCSDASNPADQLVLSIAEVRSLADFFRLLDRWDRMSTKVTEERVAPEETAA